MAVIKENNEDVEPLNMPLLIGNKAVTILVDYKSTCCMPNYYLAPQFAKNSNEGCWLTKVCQPPLRTR